MNPSYLIPAAMVALAVIAIMAEYFAERDQRAPFIVCCVAAILDTFIIVGLIILEVYQ